MSDSMVQKVKKQYKIKRYQHALHAPHLFNNGYDFITVQELSGHKDVKTTMIYTCVLTKTVRPVKTFHFITSSSPAFRSLLRFHPRL